MNVRIDLLHVSGGMDGILFNIIDVLRIANQLWRSRHPGKRTALFSWQIIDASGAALPLPEWLADLGAPAGGRAPGPSRSALLVPGLMMRNVPDLERQIDRAEAECACIARYHAQGRVVATVINGSALLARAGILEGRRATISWIVVNWFAARFPGVRLTMDGPVVEDGTLFTAGAPAAHYDLAVALVRHFAGEELAQTLGNVLVHNPMRFEHAGLSFTGLSVQSRNSVVFKAKRWLREHIQTPYNLEEVAREAAVSPRTLLRHFQEVEGITPLDYLHRLRVERAKQLLEVTLIDLAEVMEYCGYRDPSAFRRLFHRATGLTPSAYRRKYTLRSGSRWWRADEDEAEDPNG
ncbi:MAG: GlxA family transcriptional regulator [Pseudodonghicola sp.]